MPLLTGRHLDRLIAAFNRFKAKTRSPLQLVLAGSDWHGAEVVHDSIRQSPCARDIRSLGFVPDTDLPDLYRAATAFVYPSLYEGFGLPLLEAMASGGCVVARAASAMAEVVGDAGGLTDIATPSALAATLASVLRDPARRDALRAAARTRAAGFTIRAMAQATHDVYRSLAGAAHA